MCTHLTLQCASVYCGAVTTSSIELSVLSYSQTDANTPLNLISRTGSVKVSGAVRLVVSAKLYK